MKYILASYITTTLGEAKIREVINGENKHYTVDSFMAHLKKSSPKFNLSHYRELEQVARAITLLHENFEKYYKLGVENTILDILNKATDEWHLTLLCANQLKTVLMQDIFNNLDFIIAKAQHKDEQMPKETNTPNEGATTPEVTKTEETETPKEVEETPEVPKNEEVDTPIEEKPKKKTSRKKPTKKSKSTDEPNEVIKAETKSEEPQTETSQQTLELESK